MTKSMDEDENEEARAYAFAAASHQPLRALRKFCGLLAPGHWMQRRRLRDDPARRRRPLRDAAGAGARRRPSLAARIRGGDALLWSGTDQRRAFERDDDALGYLLTFFLEFFGRHFDPQRHAVSVLRGDAGIIAMAGPGYTTDPQFVAPLIEDPLECTRNVSRSCFGIAQIQNVFAHCLCILESKGAAAAMSDDSCNILSLVLSY